MRRAPKLDVEPLCDNAWNRIERALLRRLDEAPSPTTSTRFRRLGFGVALAAAAASFALVAYWSLRQPPARSSAPSSIVTDNSASEVGFAGATLDVAPHSALFINGDEDRGFLVVLDRGEVTCDVAPRHGRPPFVVQAGSTRVTVVGTRFTVTRSGDEATVAVQRGIVEVTARGTALRVPAGERWPMTSTPPPSAPAPALLRKEASQSRHEPSIAKMAPSPVHPDSTRRRQIAAPSSTVAEATAPKATSPTATEPTAPGAPIAPTTVAPRSEPAAARGETAPSDEQRYETAALAEARDPDVAIAGYRALAAGHSVWSANALFASGRLQAERGRRADARRLLHEYLDRFPSGPNVDDARQLLERLR